ncbi:MAG: MMPL family transporter [Planctomycetaceae bacterium]|nr:MMPL family transporter [Planctomycetaceae bacterium]
MFSRLAAVVVRFWPVCLGGWLLVLAVSWRAAPDLNDVVTSGEFAFLPATSPSRVGEELFARAWDDPLASRIVIVVSCKSGDDRINELDERFIDRVLKPAIEQVAEQMGGLASTTAGDEVAGEENSADDGVPAPSAPDSRSLIARVRTFKDRSIGRLLQSRDGRASLVIVELTTEFLNRENFETIRQIEELISTDIERDPGHLWSPGLALWKETDLNPQLVQQRLKLSTSGEATVGRDMLRASDESASATETWTVILVVVLLVLLYRAPIIALIPLVTVVVAVKISMSLLTLGAAWGIVNLFRGIEVYVTVLSYGAGVDYCFFLIARYREELDAGATPADAVERALSRVGAALTASAGTVICGIGMMVFARFGKFQQAGVGISFGLSVVLVSSLTFTPALLRLVGGWAFWPRRYGLGSTGTAGWVATESPVGRWLRSNPVQSAWDGLAAVLVRRPATIWVTSVALMLPLAAWGAAHYTTLSYGLLSELPRATASVKGAAEVQAYFPAGNAGPVTLLLENQQLDFSSQEGRERITWLSNFLRDRKQALKIADVRSLSHPYGLDGGSGVSGSLIERRIRRRKLRQYYVSDSEAASGRVTRIDIVFDDDPFSRDSIRQLTALENAVEEHLGRKESPGWVPADVENLLAVGPTASIRDLKQVTDNDQIRIDLLVLAVVYAILLVLLRRPAISLYLIVGVFLSYLAALGVTFIVFEFIVADPGEFAGLDWKVPMFLFTILIAIGEDYNIFLMTRIEEEQQEHGLVGGVVEALKKTGSIIAGCGVIMAGTFSSLLAGSLVGMHQLGFALAFGVLLDTLVVMPILVPAWLILLYQGRLGRVGRWLGAPAITGMVNSGSEADRDPGSGGLSAGR